jgi:hypothetical protein
MDVFSVIILRLSASLAENGVKLKEKLLESKVSEFPGVAGANPYPAGELGYVMRTPRPLLAVKLASVTINPRILSDRKVTFPP